MDKYTKRFCHGPCNAIHQIRVDLRRGPSGLYRDVWSCLCTDGSHTLLK
jgi:hypothetical protein